MVVVLICGKGRTPMSRENMFTPDLRLDTLKVKVLNSQRLPARKLQVIGSGPFNRFKNLPATWHLMAVSKLIVTQRSSQPSHI